MCAQGKFSFCRCFSFSVYLYVMERNWPAAAKMFAPAKRMFVCVCVCALSHTSADKCDAIIGRSMNSGLDPAALVQPRHVPLRVQIVVGMRFFVEKPPQQLSGDEQQSFDSVKLAPVTVLLYLLSGCCRRECSLIASYNIDSGEQKQMMVS